jgi:predicted unusual protein kinase regulating ubiquinone biosynthesis (AarF/ABC1/UbiB family)
MVHALRRLLQIGFAVCAYLLWWLLVRLHLWHPSVTSVQRLCRTIERLGTTFVKLGQGMSLHRDLLPDEYIRALQSLQDHVAPFPDEVARREVEQALGKPVAELFAEFEAHPMAAASIAQVHQALLHDGRQVVVKIRRPHIKAQIDRDMRLLRGVLRALLALMPWLRRYEPLAIVDEIWTNLRKETDFRREARKYPALRRGLPRFGDRACSRGDRRAVYGIGAGAGAERRAARGRSCGARARGATRAGPGRGLFAADIRHRPVSRRPPSRQPVHHGERAHLFP